MFVSQNSPVLSTNLVGTCATEDLWEVEVVYCMSLVFIQYIVIVYVLLVYWVGIHPLVSSRTCYTAALFTT